MSKKFIIAMHNYFTRSKVIAALSDINIGQVMPPLQFTSRSRMHILMNFLQNQ